MAIESPHFPAGILPVAKTAGNERGVNSSSVFHLSGLYGHKANVTIAISQIMRFVVVQPTPLLEPLALKEAINNLLFSQTDASGN